MCYTSLERYRKTPKYFKFVSDYTWIGFSFPFFSWVPHLISSGFCAIASLHCPHNVFLIQFLQLYFSLVTIFIVSVSCVHTVCACVFACACIYG